METSDTARLTPFPSAVPVRNIAEAREFYGGILGCSEGRSAEHGVDGHGVPVPHYGVILEMSVWEALAARLREKGVRFVIEPYIRFAGQVGERATLFLMDPTGLEPATLSVQD
jgi:uncharacterized protein